MRPHNYPTFQHTIGNTMHTNKPTCIWIPSACPKHWQWELIFRLIRYAQTTEKTQSEGELQSSCSRWVAVLPLWGAGTAMATACPPPYHHHQGQDWTVRGREGICWYYRWAHILCIGWLSAFDNQPPCRSAFYLLAQVLLSLQCYCPDCDVVNGFVSTNYWELKYGDILEHSSSVQEVYTFTVICGNLWIWMCVMHAWKATLLLYPIPWILYFHNLVVLSTSSLFFHPLILYRRKPYLLALMEIPQHLWEVSTCY